MEKEDVFRLGNGVFPVLSNLKIKKKKKTSRKSSFNCHQTR